MYCLFCMGKREAFLLAGLKAFFVLLTRGLVGACLSLSGGLLSVAMMLLLLVIVIITMMMIKALVIS